MFVTRRVDFSASHFCRLPDYTESQNREYFGDEANPNGHGHNFVLEVTLEGDPDPVNGMVIDLKRVKEILEEEVVQPMDHRFLNYEVPPFDQVVPTTPNLAKEIWRRLDGRFTGFDCILANVRLYETADLYVDVNREDVDSKLTLGEELVA